MAVLTAVPVRFIDWEERYRASARGPELVRVPEMGFLMVDGHGDPNASAEFQAALGVLYSLSYTLRFAIKKELGVVYRVGALEALWWSDDMAAFSAASKADWQWTAMIAQPDEVTAEWLARACDEVARKKPDVPVSSARLERFDEGVCGQILHLGPYSAEEPTIARLHAFLHELGATFDGRRHKHHEIYLGDPRRTAPEKWRTIVRQPIDELD